MPYVVNITPFQAQAIEQKFYNGHLYDCIFIKASFKLTHNGQLLPLTKQAPFIVNDVYEKAEHAHFSDHPALAYPSDILPYKPATDVLVIGHAKPAANTPTERWIARLKIADHLDKVIQITGPRHWEHTLLGGWQLTDIQPASAVNLSYSNTYGGGSQHERLKERDLYLPNPFGRVFLGRDQPDTSLQYPAPQLLQAQDIDPVWGKPGQPASFSPLDGLQAERLQYAGTYDQQWQDQVAPNIPLDMDLAFWNTAPADQLARPWLLGGERVYTLGLFPTEDGQLSFSLPEYDVLVVPVKNGQPSEAYSMNLDTVVLDLDQRHVTVRWCTLVSQTHGFDEYQTVAYPGKANRATLPGHTETSSS
ncbi:DUF2169 family type VI secretion system accessory protein [Lampropedia aestuarii]|uniref:DUF2169 family type VI secretion system accessory protein n=1 Tax=Lampropedia aestuarii TaxID=2562762 RepID=UPI0024693E03|nr:DUF2169 domain-containing protein [Lampropedia aestuarii]MDH5858726.1 DUF2169 domain-containing protein [Lampropedia aestuarii]